MTPEACRARAANCERMAKSIEKIDRPLGETMRDLAGQWRQLADDDEVRRANPLLGFGETAT